MAENQNCNKFRPNRNKSPYCLSFGRLQNFSFLYLNFYTSKLVLLSEVLSAYSLVSAERAGEVGVYKKPNNGTKNRRKTKNRYKFRSKPKTEIKALTA